jgi:NTE family protein
VTGRADRLARTAFVLSGGGERVVAWETGLLAGLVDTGIDPGRAAVLLGTSAGAMVATRCAGGVDPRRDADAVLARPPATEVPAAGGAAALFAQLAAVWSTAPSPRHARRLIAGVALAKTPGDEAGFVGGVASRLPEVPWPVRLRVVALHAVTGDRQVFDAGSGVPPARGVAASRAIPVACPPVTIDGVPYVDGAVGSATNADLLLADVKDGLVDEVVVCSATRRGPAASPVDALWAAALDAEVAALTDAGARVVVHAAGHTEQVAMGPDPMSGASAALAVTAGREAGRALGRRLAA